MPKVTFQLASRVGREFPSIRRAGITVVDDHGIVEFRGLAAGEQEAFCRDVESIVYSEFEGKIKDLEWCVYPDGFVSVYPIPETAIVV